MKIMFLFSLSIPGLRLADMVFSCTKKLVKFEVMKVVEFIQYIVPHIDNLIIEKENTKVVL